MLKYIIFKIWTILLFTAFIPFHVNGISYKFFSSGCFTSVHLITIDPNENIILLVKASGDEIERETVLTLCKRYGAIAAVNGGFWKLNGSAAGILKINNHWYGTSIISRGAIGWSNTRHKVLFDKVSTNFQLNDGLMEGR